jgi:hypothetical protein
LVLQGTSYRVVSAMRMQRCGRAFRHGRRRLWAIDASTRSTAGDHGPRLPATLNSAVFQWSDVYDQAHGNSCADG